MKTKSVISILVMIMLQSCCQNLGQHELKDLKYLPQDPVLFLDKDRSQSLLIDKSTHNNLCQNFLQGYFAPWKASGPLYTAKEVFWGLESFAQKDLFGPNLCPRSEQWWQELVANCQTKSYPSIHKRAITVSPTDMRVMPSHEPAFYDYRQPGEGFPFDMFQNNVLPANTPVLLSHVSQDKAWYLAQTASVSGWVKTSDVAYVDQYLINKFINRPLVIALRDSFPIKDDNGIFRFKSQVGTLFPLLDHDKDIFHVALAGKRLDGSATMISGSLPDSCAALFPIPPTSENIAKIAGEMIGQPYGWGGLYNNRDCSATMQDLFKVFGIWLPRNSSQQAESGQVISLGSKTAEEKKALIKDKAIPFFSFLTLPGHIMLYLGMYEKKITVFHNLWGIRTWDLTHGQGRHIIGKTVITSLSPGSDLVNYAHQGNLLRRLKALTILPPSRTDF